MSQNRNKLQEYCSNLNLINNKMKPYSIMTLRNGGIKKDSYHVDFTVHPDRKDHNQQSQRRFIRYSLRSFEVVFHKHNIKCKSENRKLSCLAWKAQLHSLETSQVIIMEGERGALASVTTVPLVSSKFRTK